MTPILHELIQYAEGSRRPGYFYLFGENRDWNSRDNLKIFGKVRKNLPYNLKNMFFLNK